MIENNSMRRNKYKNYNVTPKGIRYTTENAYIVNYLGTIVGTHLESYIWIHGWIYDLVVGSEMSKVSI